LDTRQRSRGRIQLEEDFDDEALLGKATLQKLADSKREKDAETTVETTETETQAFDFDDEDEEE